MQCNAPIAGPRHDRNWWDDGPEPPPPTPDPIWRGLLIAVCVTFVVAAGIALRVWGWS